MSSTPEKTSPSRLKRSLRLTINILVPLLILAAAVGFYKHQMNSRPQAQRRPTDAQLRLVSIQSVQRKTQPVVLYAMGTVRPAKEVALSPEVSGVIIEMDPAVIPGGQVKQGQMLYRIDARDYEAVVQQRQSELARAELALTLEKASQTVARQEYALLGDLVEEQDKDLVLRKPQLENAHQAADAAKAALDKARLDVQRCTIIAPFNAVIKSKHADIGARVGPTTPLAVLTGTAEYWVETLIPTEQLQWLRFAEGQQDGSSVRVYTDANQNRQGRLLRLLGQLEEAGRMAQALVCVPDPLGINDPSATRLLVGAYVRVEIEGIPLPDAVVLPREYLRDGDNVWVMNAQDKLEIRPVQIGFRGRDKVYVTGGLEDGCRVITSELATPVPGTGLRIDAAMSAQTQRSQEPQP